MTIYTSSPTKTLALGDSVVINGKTGTVSRCLCGEAYALYGLFKGHSTLEELTDFVREEFAKIDGAKREVKRGDVYRNTKNGATYMAIPVEDVGMNPWSLIRLDGATPGKFYLRASGFDGDEKDFEFIGTAGEVLKIEVPKEEVKPIFKVGEVWRTKAGHLMKVYAVMPNGIGCSNVIHSGTEKTFRPDYRYSIHPKGGYAGGTGDSYLKDNDTENEFAFVEKVSI